jgi:hypothetical protein
MRKRDLAPLSGALFVVLLIVGFVGLAGNTPAGDAAAGKVSYYTDNDTQQGVAAIIGALSAVPLVLFAASLRERLRLALPDRSVLPGFAFGAGVVAAAGLLGSAAVHLALSDHAGDVQPAAAQAMNAIDGYAIVPFAVGLVTMVLATSVAAIRGAPLPTWLGWAGVALFVGSFTPVAFFAVVLAGIWILAASVVLYLRSGSAQPRLSLGESSGATSPVA